MDTLGSLLSRVRTTQGEVSAQITAEEERLEAERLEAERLEAERLEAERLEAERQEAERLEAERLEAERQEAERQEAEWQEDPQPVPEDNSSTSSDSSSSGGYDGYTGCRAYGGNYVPNAIDEQGRPYTKIDCVTRLPLP